MELLIWPYLASSAAICVWSLSLRSRSHSRSLLIGMPPLEQQSRRDLVACRRTAPTPPSVADGVPADRPADKPQPSCRRQHAPAPPPRCQPAVLSPLPSRGTWNEIH